MSIRFIPYIHGAAPGVWIAPATVHDRPDDFELSLSNANGFDILLALGLAPEPAGGPTPIDSFAALVTAAHRRHLGRRSPELAPSTQAGEGKMPIVFLGRREGYIEERLGDLARLIQHSRVAGATHIGWG